MKNSETLLQKYQGVFVTNIVGASLIKIENVLESIDLSKPLNLFMKYVEFKDHIGT